MPTKELGHRAADVTGEGSRSAPVPASGFSYLNRFTNSESSTDEEGTWMRLHTAGAETALCIVLNCHLNDTGFVNALYRAGFSLASWARARAGAEGHGSWSRAAGWGVGVTSIFRVTSLGEPQGQNRKATRFILG